MNRNLRASVDIKRALERTGRYEVAAFTTPDAALDHLRHAPGYGIVIVDFNLPRVNGRDVVLRVRAFAPDALIIASPDTPEVARIVSEMKLGGVVDLPSPARKLITVIDRIVDKGGAATPETTESPARGADARPEVNKSPPPDAGTPVDAEPQSATDKPQEPAFSSLDDVLVRIGGFEGEMGTETVDVDMSDADYADDNTVEFILTGEYAALKEEFDRNPEHGPYKEDGDEAVDIFQRIAAEEPPPPTFEEGGTVSDLMIGVGDTNLQAVVNILRESRSSRRTSQDVAVTPPLVEGDESSEPESTPEAPEGVLSPPSSIPETGPMPPADTAARHILENALDETSPLTFSLDEFKSRVKSRGGDVSKVKALPSWEQEIDRFVREPEFLEPKIMPELHPDDPSEQPTDLVHVDLHDPAEADTSNLPLSPVPKTDLESALDAAPAPPASMPEEKAQASEPESAPDAASADDPVDEWESAEVAPPKPPPLATKTGEVPRPTTIPEAVEDPEEATLPPIEGMVKQQQASPEVARLALALTHGSLEATAALTLLARDGKIVGYSGEMPVAEIELLRRAIHDDWSADGNNARIRFVRVEQSGTDYVLYTRGSEGGYHLSLVFAGDLEMQNMRQQFDKLVSALRDVPPLLEASSAEIDAEIDDMEEALSRTQAEAAVMTGRPATEIESKPVTALSAYTLVWLVRDPEMTLTSAIAQAIVAGLDFQLSREGWQMDAVRVFEDYVYIEAGVPEDMPVPEVIGTLKQRSAQIARSADARIDPQELWLDSYLAMMPAREMDIHEIQRFIHFARAR